MLDPVPLERPRPGRVAPPGDDPGSREIALLAQIGPQDPDIEVSGLDAVQPVVEHPKRRVNGYGLMVAGRRARANRARVRAVLPEEGSNPRPIAPGETPFVAAEQLMNGVLVPPGTRGSAVFDPAPESRQEAEAQRRKTETAQADRPCISSWARSSRFSRRLPGVSSA